MLRLLAVVAVVFAAGCVSVPETDTAPRTSAEYVLDKDALAQKPGTGQLTIKRDSWPLHVYRMNLFVDGKPLGSIGSGEVLTVYLPQGRRLIGVGPRGGGGDKPTVELGIDIGESRPAYAHLTLNPWGWGNTWQISESSS